MNGHVFGIVIQSSCVLKGMEVDTNNSQFIHGEKLSDETSASAIKRIIFDRLNLTGEIIFRVNREPFYSPDTFLIDVPDLNPRDNFDDKKLRLIPLSHWGDFTYNEKLQLTGLLETCYEQSFKPVWLKELEEHIINDQQLTHLKSNVLEKKHRLEHKEQDSKTAPAQMAFMIILSLLIGIFYNSFLSSGRFGISVSIFTCIFLAAFILVNRGNIKGEATGWFILILTLVLSTSFALHANEFLMGLNTLALPLLLTTAFILIRYRGFPWQLQKLVGQIVMRLTVKTAENIRKPFIFIKSHIKAGNSKKMTPTQKNIAIGLIISFPLLFIILPLLSSADSVFSYYLSDAVDTFSQLELGSLLWDLVVIFIVSIYTFGYLWSFKYNDAYDNNTHQPKKLLDPVSVITVLAVINIVYLLFTFVQASYLYGGENIILPNGFTYAEYARRGFFELVLVTVINFSLLVFVRAYTNTQKSPLNNWLRGLYSLLIAFTLNMLYSASFKMSIYEDAFGYTYLRLYVQLFLILLLALFIIFLVGIWSSKVKTTKLSVLAIVIMYLVLNFANVDVLIARKNIDRFERTGNIDIFYLISLSDDAVPEMTRLLTNHVKDQYITETLQQNLQWREQQLRKHTPWFEYNRARVKAIQSIEKLP